ncbi:hypothetical protein B0H16DRAFT_1471590 [Mycena metata]|uniref:Uncharacterized protein n=1 Tax=Mycena metata TaxID=1033252 RepID=A0AAD7MPB0_9AGAR|nr:hypothetical protein B0H16DRAFT_1471590 [Mycena metata]
MAYAASRQTDAPPSTAEKNYPIWMPRFGGKSESSPNWVRCFYLKPLSERIELPSSSLHELQPYHDNLIDIEHLRGSESFENTVSDVRDTDPCLQHFGTVAYHFGLHCWVVFLSSAASKSLPPIPLCVGQRPVYVTHGNLRLNHTVADILPDEIDPNAVLADHELAEIRRWLPHAFGVRLHPWGFIDVLFKSKKDMNLQLKKLAPHCIGSLGAAFIVSKHHPALRASRFSRARRTILERVRKSNTTRSTISAVPESAMLVCGSDYIFEGECVTCRVIWRTEDSAHRVPPRQYWGAVTRAC